MRSSTGIVKLREAGQGTRTVRMFTVPDSVPVQDLIGKKFTVSRLSSYGKILIIFATEEPKSKFRIKK